VRGRGSSHWRRGRAWPLRCEDGAITIAERGPCEGEAAVSAAAAGHGPCAEGDGVVANQRGRAEVLSSTRPSAVASAAALGHGTRAARGEITQLPTSTDGKMRRHRRDATEQSTPAIVGGGRAQGSSASWPLAHAQPAFAVSK
jgi:hypothetical protein